jgi:hypothetical protein
LGKRSLLNADDAENIALKLGAEITEGRKHTRVLVRLNGQFVGQYSVRRGSGELGHDFIPRQIQATIREAIDLSRCPLSREGFIAKLVERASIQAAAV